METVILDKALRARLKGLDGSMEFRDESGKLLGRFLPESEYAGQVRVLYDWAKAEFTREEAEEAARGIVRKRDRTNGKPTAEAIADLEELGRKAAGQ